MQKFDPKVQHQHPIQTELCGLLLLILKNQKLSRGHRTAFDRVCFALSGALSNIFRVGDLVNAFVKLSNISTRGQLATGFDYNLGDRVVRTVSYFRTYQIYSSNLNSIQRELSVGFLANARMESVAIGSVRPKELVQIYFNYADAALVELYRDKRNPPFL